MRAERAGSPAAYCQAALGFQPARSLLSACVCAWSQELSHCRFTLDENTTFRRGVSVIGMVFQSLLQAPFLFTFLLLVFACHLSCKIPDVFCWTDPGSRRMTLERPWGPSSIIINRWRNQQGFCLGIQREMCILPFDFRD